MFHFSNIVLVFQCDDSHVICLECFATYCRVKLDNRQFVLVYGIGYTIPCPGGGGKSVSLSMFFLVWLYLNFSGGFRSLFFPNCPKIFLRIQFF